MHDRQFHCAKDAFNGLRQVGMSVFTMTKVTFSSVSPRVGGIFNPTHRIFTDQLVFFVISLLDTRFGQYGKLSHDLRLSQHFERTFKVISNLLFKSCT